MTDVFADLSSWFLVVLIEGFSHLFGFGVGSDACLSMIASTTLSFTLSSPFAALLGLHPSVLLVLSRMMLSSLLRLNFAMSFLISKYHSPLDEALVS